MSFVCLYDRFVRSVPHAIWNTLLHLRLASIVTLTATEWYYCYKANKDTTSLCLIKKGLTRRRRRRHQKIGGSNCAFFCLPVYCTHIIPICHTRFLRPSYLQQKKEPIRFKTYNITIISGKFGSKRRRARIIF